VKTTFTQEDIDKFCEVIRDRENEFLFRASIDREPIPPPTEEQIAERRKQHCDWALDRIKRHRNAIRRLRKAIKKP
jgi:hypothetical protein